MIKYVKVTDLTLNEIAKAMIDGEVFYSGESGVSYSWDGTKFISSRFGECRIGGDYYRQIELTSMEVAKKATKIFMQNSKHISLEYEIGYFGSRLDAEHDLEFVEMCRVTLNAYDGK